MGDETGTRSFSSTPDDGAASELGEALFAEFVRGMHNLPGESPLFATLVWLHRACFLVSIGCSISVGGASAFIDLSNAMQISIWMQSFGASKPQV
jgi:hypothetical protein